MGLESRWQDSLAWAELLQEDPEQSKANLLMLLWKYAATRAMGEPRLPSNRDEQVRLEHELLATREQSFLIHWTDLKTGERHYPEGPSPKQLVFMNCPTLTRMMITSNQYGKTTMGLSWILSATLGRQPWTGQPVLYPDSRAFKPPVRAMIAGEDFGTHHAEVTIPKLKELLPWDFWVSHVDKIKSNTIGKIYLRNGSTIKLMSYEMDPDKWEGQTYDIVLFDEPPPRHAYVGTRRGCMKNGAPIGFTFTPLKEPWICDELYENERAVHIESPQHLVSLRAQRQITERSIAIMQAGMDEVKHISEERKEEFLATLDPEEREAREHGRFRHLMGLVIKTFDRERHVLPDDSRLLREAFDGRSSACKFPWGYSVDPHDRKPWYVSFFFVTPRSEIVIFDEWPHFNFFQHKSYPWTINEYADFFHQKERALGEPSWRIIDPNFGNAPKATTGTTVKEELIDRGLYFDADSNNDIEAGHILIRNAFQEERLFLTHRVNNLQRALTHYVWEDYRGRSQDTRTWKERPEDRFKDPVDTLRYLLQQDPTFDSATTLWRPRPLAANLGLSA